MPLSQKPKLTHFLCLPLITKASRSQLEASFTQFRSAVGKDIPEKAIRPIGTLHLTIGVMSLLEEDRVSGALTFLKSLDLKRLLAESVVNSVAVAQSYATVKREPSATEVAPLTVTFRGLHSMHEPQKTSILYASPSAPSYTSESLPLYQFSLLLQQKFVGAGFIIADTRPLLLHATIVNTIYAPGVRKASGARGGHGKAKAKLTVDARSILEECENMVWMEDIRLETVAICRMGARKGVDGEEKYEVEGDAELPA